MLSERSERRDAERGDAPGDDDARAALGGEIGAPADRVMLAPSAAAIELALFFVLADPGDEILVATERALTAEIASISGLDAVPLGSLDGVALFEAAGERTRAIVLDAAALDDERLALAAEIDVPIVCHGARAGLASDADAPLVVVIAERGARAWLAVLGPADRAEPLVTRLERFAPVFFARAGT